MLLEKQVFLPAFEFQSGMFFKIFRFKIERRKDGILSVGVHNLCKLFPHEFKLSIQILGVHFDYDELSRKKANFEVILKSIKRTLSMWKWRGLTLIGRIQIVKSFAIPKFMSKASLIHVSNDLIQAANKEFFNFIWKGKDRIKRFALINDIEYGVLKMMDLESTI